MKILNRQYRGVDKTTDVLSFPQISAEEMKSIRKTRCFRDPKLQTPDIRLILGDIVVNLPKAKIQATEHNLTLYEELKRLIIHGLLHLIGYDHEKGKYQKNKMESKEKELFYE
jgi:probable rRNA maturation factor